MVRITKTMQAKHLESLSSWQKEFCNTACSTSLPLLPQHLATFPTRWPFPRGDLYHWIALLNRFDVILDNFCKTYGLDEGPQIVGFTCKILQFNIEVAEIPNLEALGFKSDGDGQLIESILGFSRTLLRNCGNRSLYASSSHLSSLLNSTSLPILQATLLLGSELAQRYSAAMKRSQGPPKLSQSTLASHYDLNLDRVNQLALPFIKMTTTQPESAPPMTPGTPATPSVKGKEKAYFNHTAGQKSVTTTFYATDLVSMAKGGPAVGGSNRVRNGTETSSADAPTSWDQWGDVKLTYYPKPAPEADSSAASQRNSNTASSTTPLTPTPVRRSSNLGPHTQRSNRLSSSEDAPPPHANSSTSVEDLESNTKAIEVPFSKLKSAGVHQSLCDNIGGLPKDRQYELLTKIRVAEALTTSLETRQQILAIRLLAITNLAYIHQGTAFTENVVKHDGDEPRRLQLAYQLAELVHPPAEGDVAVPRYLQTIAFSTLEALYTHSSKHTDVCAALNTNVNHGVLLYIVRKAAAEMSSEDSGDILSPEDEWRDALFTLLATLVANSTSANEANLRTAADLVTAGIVPIMIEMLGLRNSIAERYYPKVLSFLDTIMHTTRDGHVSMSDVGGFDAISNLIIFEVATALEKAAAGEGIQVEHRSAAVDYEIPHFQKESLRWLFKFIHRMSQMTVNGGFGGNFDRLLRNLIDSSQLLASLRQVIENSHCFGASVWYVAVQDFNDFINNEPTSFAIISEAGLSRGLLEAITCKPIDMPPDSKKPKVDVEPEQSAEGSSPNTASDESDEDDNEYGQPAPRPSITELVTPRENPLARGIMPTSEVIDVIPQAFGAICLNKAGMRMFQASGALESYFEIFESPEHVKCMSTNPHLPVSLGGTFDELVRHHPHLKTAILNAVLNMVIRVGSLCTAKAEKKKIGAKLWTHGTSGPVIADEDLLTSTPKGKKKAVEDDGDVEMQDAGSEGIGVVQSQLPTDLQPHASMTPYISAVAHFLSTMLSNASIRSEFSSQRGIEYVLDLADSLCLSYDFADSSVNSTLRSVISLLVDHKPYLTVPSLLRRILHAADTILPFATSDGKDGPFFKPFVDKKAQKSAEPQFLAQGTNYVKALVNIQTLILALQSCFQQSAYHPRNNSTFFNQLHLSDYYVRLVQSLGALLGATFREEFELNKCVPDSFKAAPRVKDSGFGFTEPDILPMMIVALQPETVAQRTEAGNGDEPIDATSIPAGTTTTDPAVSERNTPEFKNYMTLRYLLGRTSRHISPFFQVLGRSLVTKRSVDTFQRQGHTAIADALAETILRQLAPRGDSSSFENAGHWIGTIQGLKDLLIDSSRSNQDRPVQTITLVLQAFKQRGGFDVVNRILESFAAEIQSTDDSAYASFAVLGMRNILSLYGQISTGKNVMEATQTTALASSREGRDRIFNPSQFLVEVRMAVLPVVRKLWESSLCEKAPSDISEKLIEVIRIIANADCEISAIKRADKPVLATKPLHKTLKIIPEHLTALDQFDSDLAREALYRCNNNLNYARDYCNDLSQEGRPRYPVPEADIAVTPTSRPRSNASAGTTTPDEQAVEHSPLPEGSVLLGLLDQEVPPGPVAPNEQGLLQVVATHQVTVDDLNDERAAIRENLTDKCLDVINAHGEVSFEVCDLITTVVAKSDDAIAQRASVGETIVMALMSFAVEDDARVSGKKVAAYAHLLALLLRDPNFYSACVDELKNNLDILLGFIKLPPTHSSDEPSPWIAHILLIVEMLLSEDAKPQTTTWSPPKDENEPISEPVLQVPEKSVLPDQRKTLLDSILDMLPRIGKDESLALAVLRILVILTRDRSVAQGMSEKKNLHRLFVMVKQVAGSSSSRIHGPLMLILRHIIEDDETIKQVMRSEIKLFFDLNRQQRTIPIALYLKALDASVIRHPKFFVAVTNEMVKYSRWQYPPATEARPLSLALKDLTTSAATPDPTPRLLDDSVQPTVQATEDLTLQDVKPSTESVDIEMPDAAKTAPPDNKLPVVENPDGVIHYLLMELLAYRTVEDAAPTPSMADKHVATANGDVSMAGTSSSGEAPIAPETKSSTSTPKPEFKAEDHPIYIYRCFILQCLTELLGSYNRTKVEFINFKRHTPPQAMTPSKPRSSVVNYLLFDLIPIGTLDNGESIALRKKAATSSWADSLITALLSKTGEQLPDKSREPSDGDDEPGLVHVRRFVLDNILKAYKEATTSMEPLYIKYARMYSLAVLMDHIMTGKENVGTLDSSVISASQKQLRRLMFEKGFITALTASIADFDLNFPGAKKAVKQILRPLKVLTNTAIQLSDLSLISTTSGQVDDDGIESATSVSEAEDDREETPDLFRNSTLGMFEPGRDEDSSSDSEDDDEEMYEDEYGDQMEYGDEADEDAEDNISDDEDIEGMGPIEGLPGDHGVEIEVEMEEEDDDDDSEDDESSEDDDEDSEDNNAREILDEAANIHELAEEHEMEEWESDDADDDHDDGEEEDYEGHAQDLDEEAEMDMPDFAGSIGNIVRALGHPGMGASPQELLEQLDEMQMQEEEERAAEEDGEDMGDRMAAEFMEEDDEDDDERDGMDDEEMFLAGPPGFQGGEPFAIGGWEGDVEPVVIGHRGHRHRGAAPPFAGLWARDDPLGGTFQEQFPHIPHSLSHRDRIPEESPFSRAPHPRMAPRLATAPNTDQVRAALNVMLETAPPGAYVTEDDGRRLAEFVLSLIPRPTVAVSNTDDTRAEVNRGLTADGFLVVGDQVEDLAATVAAINRALAANPTGLSVLEDDVGRLLEILGLLNYLNLNCRRQLNDAPTTTRAPANFDAVPEFRYRSHRPGQPPARSVDDGINPLLQRHGHGRGSRDNPFRPPPGSFAVGSNLELVDLARSPFGASPATTALFDMIRSLPDMPGNFARGGALSLHFSAGPGHSHEVSQRELRAMFGQPRGSRMELPRSQSNEPLNPGFFTPQSTTARWIEESRLLFGSKAEVEAQKVKAEVESALAPAAIAADKAEKSDATERARKQKEADDKRKEEERLAKEAKEAEEKIEREKKEDEEREAAERAAAEAAEALAARGPEPEAIEESTLEDSTAPETMDGVETEAQPSATEEQSDQPAEDRPRVTTMIRGSEFDITDLGIDPEFLAELPDDIREEVIMSTVAERRSQAAAAGAQPSEIDHDFLDALPEDIRAEIIQQERQDRRRREREEQRRQQQAANGGPAGPEMDVHSILATLAPALRQQILLEQDDETLAALPQDIADQARAARREHPHPGHHRVPGSLARSRPPFAGRDAVVAPPSAERPPRRAIVQMLDKSGIATLLRLMFTFQHPSLHAALNSVLENISLNRQNRNEVVNTLLHILQDGSVDMSAVERSFAQLSLRAKQPKDKDPKTPQPLKRTFTGISGSVSLVQINPEASPLMVVNQCLSTLYTLTRGNPHIPAFFLTEQDTVAGLKRSLSRKGKGKENKASKYAINSLLSLLDRDLIMESSSVMEILANLLSSITSPLQNFQRKQKEAEEAKKKAAEKAAAEITASTSTPETTGEPSFEREGDGAPAESTQADTSQVQVTVTETTATDQQQPIDIEVSTSEAPKPDTTPLEPEKKQRSIIPPVIPEQNLKLVINIFVARECSSRTFRDTLSTTKNLSAIPGAKAIFGRELIAKAQGLGEVILKDLEDLLPQIQKAATGTEIQGVALAKFSPGGSDQNKLLRVLTALDHLFDPKRDKKDQSNDADAPGESSQVADKQDLLSSLYENSTFGPMWEKLSACLSAIRQREHMLNVATILLPLIESLMVVCKNTTSKDTPVARAQIAKEMTLGSPPPESRMDNLFFTFTEEHRKILNDLVRHSPKLMSGTFSLLVKNPKVLEFDNKRNYFSRSIHNKNPATRQAFPPLQLSVRRDQVFHDSFKSLYFQTGDQMKYGKLSIRFHGEEGVDAGGVTREWFQVLSRQMFDPGYALFVPVSSDRTTFHPNQLSSVNEEHLMFFKFIGRIIGKALYEGRVLDCHFSRAVYKRILGKSVSLKDMESLDPDYYKSLIWMLENDITDIITETFSVDNDKFGVVETIDFIENGRNVPVTESNKHEYVRLMVEWKLTGSVKAQLDDFLKGFHEIIPAELVAIFNEQELELLISGLPEIDVDDWKSHTEYQNYTASSPQIQWFWRAVRSYDKEERAKLLQFVTGTSKVPLNGFKELEGMNGFSRFNIHRDYGSKDRLPSSHTCFNQLDLPEYESYEALRAQVLTAITAGSSYFGFA